MKEEVLQVEIIKTLRYFGLIMFLFYYFLSRHDTVLLLLSTIKKKKNISLFRGCNSFIQHLLLFVLTCAYFVVTYKILIVQKTHTNSPHICAVFSSNIEISKFHTTHRSKNISFQTTQFSRLMLKHPPCLYEARKKL